MNKCKTSSSTCHVTSIGVNHGGTGGTKGANPALQNLKKRVANVNCAPYFVIFQNFQHQIACIQCSNGVSTPLLDHSIHYFPKVHLQRPPNRTSGGKFNIFLGRHCLLLSAINVPPTTPLVITLHLHTKLQFYFSFSPHSLHLTHQTNFQTDFS